MSLICWKTRVSNTFYKAAINKRKQGYSGLVTGISRNLSIKQPAGSVLTTFEQENVISSLGYLPDNINDRITPRLQMSHFSV